LNYALLCSSQRECKHKASIAKQKSSLFLFFGTGRGGYLRSVAPFSPKPSLTPLYVISCYAMRRFKFAFFKMRVSVGKI